MKVELDLSAEQLQELDKGLTELLKTLSSEQKTEIVKTYLETKMDEGFYTRKDSFYNSRNELSSFGQEVINGLQDKIKENISDKLFSNEVIKEKIDEILKSTTNNLESIIETAISTYVVNNLFTHQQDLQQQIRNTIYDMRYRGELK